MGWFYLFLAIILEVIGTLAMKQSKGFSVLLPSCTSFAAYGSCLALVTLAVNRIDLSIVYAVWAGLGTAIISLIGVFYYKEPATLLKIISICLIIGGVIGLNLEA